jgi:hypothetical protein
MDQRSVTSSEGDQIQDHDHRRRAFLHISASAALSAFILGTPGCIGSAPTTNTRINDMTLSLQEISDRFEIQELLVRYCYAVDDRDWDSYRKIFTPDAVIDDTVTGGVRSGVEEHIAYMKKALSKILISQHAISTTLIDIKGDDASVRTHCSCPMVVDLGNGKTQVFFQGLWYRNKIVRTPDGWKIKELIEEGYWTHNIPTGFKF